MSRSFVKTNSETSGIDYSKIDLIFLSTLQNSWLLRFGFDAKGVKKIFIRGRTFSNSFIIVDEAQNASIHELKTIITRIGENSKIVLMGDTDQIDTPYLNKKSNGLAIVIDRMKNSKHSAHIHLQRGERSELATYASKVL